MLKLRLLDDGMVVAEKKGNFIDDFEDIMEDLKHKYKKE